MRNDYAVVVGLDWADKEHTVCRKDVSTGEVQSGTLKHRAEAINSWVLQISQTHPEERIAVVLEQKIGKVVYALMEYGNIDIYPVNPSTVSNYRKAFYPSGRKTDPGDAKLLLELFERHPEEMKILQPDTKLTRKLGVLCRDRRKMVDNRSALCNALKQTLKEYFPQALELVPEDMYAKMTCDFLMKWPEFEALPRAQEQTVRKFYHRHNSRSNRLIEERLELIASGRPVCTDQAVLDTHIMRVQALVRQIRELNRTIKKYDHAIAVLFRDHEDAFIFESLPGAGEKLAPRLLTAFGTNRSRYKSGVEASTFIGVAPVVESSGNQEWIHWRWNCPTFLRQGLMEFAWKSTENCEWARIYYEEMIERGRSRPAAARALAFKWVKIIYRCWQRREAYDEEKYLAALKKHGSWIVDELQKKAA